MRALLLRLAPLVVVSLLACASREGLPGAPEAQGGAGAEGVAGAPASAGTSAGGTSSGGQASGASGTTSGTGGKAPVEATIRYLSLGDSFTIGTGSTPEKSFPARLVGRWQGVGQGATLKNPAVNGYTSQRILETEVPELGPFAPTFVTLAAGANDIVQGRSDEAYRTSVHAIVQAVLAAGVQPVRLVAIPQPDWPASPTGMSFGDVTELRARITQLNDILRDEVQSVGGRYVDLSALMLQQSSQKMFAPDGLHPSAEAYDAWAAALFDALPDLRP